MRMDTDTLPACSANAGPPRSKFYLDRFPVKKWLGWTWKKLASWLCREDPQRIRFFDWSGCLLLLVTGVWYLHTYWRGGLTPDVNPLTPEGWWGWCDQGQYYKSTIELAHGQLKPNVYWLGYPLLGVPFYWLMPRHPYLIPNLAFVLIMVGAFFAACRHLMGRVEAWILVGFFIFSDELFRDICLIVPWNTMPAYATIYLATYLLLFRRPSMGSFALCAFMAGIALFARPTEIMPIALIYSFGLFNLDGRRRLFALAFFGIALGMVAFATFSLNLYFYRRLSSPYMESLGTEFSAINFGPKIYQFFCDGAFLTGNAAYPRGSRTTQILERFPYFLLLLPGAIYLVRTRGYAPCGLLLAIIFTVAFYLSYNWDTSMALFWTYSCYHYIWWIMPWLAFVTYLSFRGAPFALSRFLYLAALAAPVLLYLVVGFKAVEVAASDNRENPVTLTTHYQDQVYTVDITSASYAGCIQDVRLQFVKSTSYWATEVATLLKVKLTVNGIEQRVPKDYAMSQDGQAYDFSFLVRNLNLREGDHVMIRFAQTNELTLTRASYRQIQFAPGNGVARFFTR